MPPSSATEGVLRVRETFVSLQGEGTAAGRPAFFVRLSGCNLSCRWCDTPESRLPGSGTPLPVNEILERRRRSGLSEVLITGGEPLLQEAVYTLMEALLAEGVRVYLETNGSLSLRRVPREVIKIVDWKPPSSGMSNRMNPENLRYLRYPDQIKFVIADEEDYLWAKREVLSRGLFRFVEVLFSPVWEEMPPEKLARLILADRLPVRLQIQLHKLLGLP
ncbi:radical SAM protein [Thermosulfurimonas sp. F29]|uniref:7-carboxy-7-deazaguanine synthase QueE n=1 Tax=Thermosulfurimonas sp. F29 TaxID=2867247 RepID=UPI001C831E91|nr:radical SAM protein [Thermosulfurimonas sp. F29]MBX6422702.1 radical SAM protein [Thermosulfurimonas sp. F29]